MIGGLANGLGAHVTFTPPETRTDVTALGGWGAEEDVAEAGAVNTPAERAMLNTSTRRRVGIECT